MKGGQPSPTGSRHGSFAIPVGQLLGSVDGQVNAGVGVGVGVGRLVPQGRIPNVGQPTPLNVQKFPRSITVPQVPCGSVQAAVFASGALLAQTQPYCPSFNLLQGVPGQQMSGNTAELKLSLAAALFAEKKLTGNKGAGSTRFCASKAETAGGDLAHSSGGRDFGKQRPSPSGLFLKGNGRAPKVVNPVPSP